MNVSRTKLVGVALVIFAATVWLYWPSIHGEFLDGDDEEYLRAVGAVERPDVERGEMGVYVHAIRTINPCRGCPMFWTTRFGERMRRVTTRPASFVHALNAALVFGFLWTLLGATSLTTGERLAVALWVAVVFAIHPLQVESVAWMSGRTQLLCTTFGIGCLWAYAAGARRWVVWGLYAAALLCKPMAVSLPFVMLAMDYFPLRRHEQFGWGRLLWEKAVLIALAVAAGLATMITKSQLGEIVPLAAIPLSQRVFLMCSRV